MDDLTGKQFGPYEIREPLGEGGMAAVYKAYQASMNRYVAIKVLPRQMAKSPEFITRFQREAHLLAQLQHPHILPVFDYGQADGYTYIVMPCMQNGTLAQLMEERRLSLPEIRRILSQVGDALGYAHVRGMIHRDVKPSNVLLDERGNCLLTDFGLARMVESTSGSVTSDGTIMGTPAYMSPEQGKDASVDGRSDLYSLGIIFYEVLTGQVPYYAKTPVALVLKHISDPVPSARNLVPNLTEGIDRVVAKSLAKDPDERYQTAEDFVRAMQQAIPINPGGKAVSRVLDSVYDRLLTEAQDSAIQNDEEEQAKETVIVSPPGTPSPSTPPPDATVISTPETPADNRVDATLLAPPLPEDVAKPPSPAPDPSVPKKRGPRWPKWRS